MNSKRTVRGRPPLRWIGGKQRLASRLLQYFPEEMPTGRYYEPFLGAGSLFFALAPQRATLSDVNRDLVECYRQIRDRPDAIHRQLKRWSGRFDRERYLEARTTFNNLSHGIKRAALFIVLNRTCFNGIWRVSTRGDFNVPFGGYEHPLLPTITDLRVVAQALKGATVSLGDYEARLSRCKGDDFIYLDPPYPPVNGTSFFVHYSPARFPLKEQERVVEVMDDLTNRGCRVMVSNAGTPAIRKLFRGYRIEDLPTTRYVGAGGVRHRVDDIVILNYSKTGRVRKR